MLALPKLFSLQRFSFRQLLLVAFLLIAGLLASACLRELFLLEHLLQQSSQSSAQSLAHTADAQRLAEHAVNMERAARQFLILDDPVLHQRFDDFTRQARADLQRLSQSGVTPEQIQDWNRLLNRISVQLQTDSTTSESLRARESDVTAGFRELESINTLIAQQVRDAAEIRNRDLMDQLEAGRRALVRQIVVSMAIAVVLALVFGLWLARPLKQLESVIVALGENRLDESIEINGTKDLRRLGRRLDWLRMRLAELDSDQSRFLRNVSHELKTPLAALREGVALLDDGVTGTLSAPQRDVIRILKQNTSVLQAQIEDLLRFNAAAFDAQRLIRKREDLIDVIRAVVDQQRLQWQARQLQVQVFGSSLFLEVDAEKLQTALGNLFSNAIRFSPLKGHIEFHVRRSGEQAIIDIDDQGPGIAPADRDRIFEPFYRGERQPDDAPRGSGIGLSIVYETIISHGGTLTLTDEQPGAHFRIQLPCPAQ